MPLIATLIGNPASGTLSPQLAYAAMRALKSEEIHWLGDHIACDITLPTGMGAQEGGSLLRSMLEKNGVDNAVQEAATRRKKALIADMDSTIIDQECIDELAAEAGFGEQVAEITARAMNGEIAFEPALRERVALLEGLELAVIDHVLENRICLAAGARQLVMTMRKHGARTVLVSGGFTRFTGPIAETAGFDEHHANTLIEDADKLTGGVMEPILGREAKVDRLLAVASQHGLSPQDFIAVGDGANDLGMLQLAGTGVALHAKPVVAEQARIRIDHGDLTALLYLQGYRQSEFVS